MSILTHLIDRANDLTFYSWHLDRDQQSDVPLPKVEFQVRINIPIKEIDEDLWYKLDDDFQDPETSTLYYNYDFDGDEVNRWGSFRICAKNSDISEALDMLRGEVEAMQGWLTTLSGRDMPTV